MSILWSAVVASTWFVVVLGLAAVVTRLASLSRFALVALLHDAMPVLLAAGILILVGALIGGDYALATAAAPLLPFEIWFWFRARSRADRPAWVGHAPSFAMLVTNVFIDNETPEAMAALIVESMAEIVVVVEWNPRIAAALQAAGGDAAYPHRVFDPNDDTDYAVALLCKNKPVEFGVEHVNSIAIARATVAVGTASATVLGVNPYATADPGGYEKWTEQTNDLEGYLSGCPRPFVVAGDFNSSQFRPGFQRLLDLGLTDVHDSLGEGMSRSFKLRPDGVLGAVGAVARLDHALLSADLFARDVRDLEAVGSDHLPFVTHLAVRPTR